MTKRQLSKSNSHRYSNALFQPKKFIPYLCTNILSWNMNTKYSNLPPTESISSINITQGALSLASSNKLLTASAPDPTNILSNSAPAAQKKGTFASPATALANSVLPVPGGPEIMKSQSTLVIKLNYSLSQLLTFGHLQEFSFSVFLSLLKKGLETNDTSF